MAPKRRRQDKAQSKGYVVTQKRIKLQVKTSELLRVFEREKQIESVNRQYKY